MAQARQARDVASYGTSRGDVLKEWRTWGLVERGLAPGTIEAYERELRRVPLLREASASDLREVLHAHAGSPATVARRVAAWRSFYGFLVRTGQRTDDPTAGLDRPKVHRGLPRPVADHESRLGSLDSPYREIAIVILETGLRISEACSIETPVPVPRSLRVSGKGGKDRVVPLSEPARRALTLLDGRIEASPRTIQRRFRSAGFTPHQLRHTFASELAEADVDLSVIQDLLGHASPATTRVYQANSAERLRRGIERRRGTAP